jgi:hypothetical protein
LTINQAATQRFNPNDTRDLKWVQTSSCSRAFYEGEFGMMTDKRTQQEAENSNMAKDPDEWVTGDEPMTGAQRSYLKTLSEEAHEPLDENLTKAEASKRIEELQRKTGRGTSGSEESWPGSKP